MWCTVTGRLSSPRHRVRAFLVAFLTLWFGLNGAGYYGQAWAAAGDPFLGPSNNTWTRVEVPGARCGDGSPYAVFLRQGQAERLVIELSGGGACWDKRSCYGPIPLTRMSLSAPGEESGLASPDPNASPFADATYVWLPYCTGDVHAGTHIANYEGAQVIHDGSTNVRSSAQVLESSLGLMSAAREVYLVGRSAGAIGVLLHLAWFDAMLSNEVRRVALVDSPGLHFGTSFWNKFSDAYFGDVRDHMAEIGLSVTRGEGLIAPQLPGLCQRYDQWKIGFLQSTRDRVMSLVFGSISQARHERAVLGDTGLAQLVRQQSGECYAWIHDSAGHTFTGSTDSIERGTRGVTAAAFARSIVSEGPGLSILP